jgi:hypothetical protein
MFRILNAVVAYLNMQGTFNLNDIEWKKSWK